MKLNETLMGIENGKFLCNELCNGLHVVKTFCYRNEAINCMRELVAEHLCREVSNNGKVITPMVSAHQVVILNDKEQVDYKCGIEWSADFNYDYVRDIVKKDTENELFYIIHDTDLNVISEDCSFEEWCEFSFEQKCNALMSYLCGFDGSGLDMRSGISEKDYLDFAGVANLYFDNIPMFFNKLTQLGWTQYIEVCDNRTYSGLIYVVKGNCAVAIDYEYGIVEHIDAQNIDYIDKHFRNQKTKLLNVLML